MTPYETRAYPLETERLVMRPRAESYAPEFWALRVLEKPGFERDRVSTEENGEVARHLRDAMARIDVTQPQYWVLNRVNGGPAAPSREEVTAQLAALAGGPHEISRTVDQLLHRGWLRTGTGGELHLTDAGEAARSRLRGLVTALRAEVHRGIDDEEYVAALKVLRTMIANVEGAGEPQGADTP
ncbi:MarR family winged helix-turn-helix transcriptional regulator [Streptomyces sp. WAC08241]|uniref:MarR family winged helix-turn-helix transcriptional regulator n=1 Tax=Streptomyces sp. WAC08241 TaxID=2487421 RepID=UPI0021AF3BD1|nr:MarR family winged helix-turn-helix transcriptional regulator [Streptomyces sp. WAC08241]